MVNRMVVLLIGGGSVLMDAVISKLTKNGHRVYLLTGQKNNRFSYKKVFEKYDFAYESGSIKDIFESTRPDAVVFTGAFDTNFDWQEDARQESVRYVAGIVNILSACSVVKGCKFIYFSSHEVFGDVYIDKITEVEPVSPKGFKAMALVQGEETCENFRRTQGMDTQILRFDHMYWIPEKGTARFRIGKLTAAKYLLVINGFRRRGDKSQHHLHKLQVYQSRSGLKGQVLADPRHVIRIQPPGKQPSQAAPG